MTNEDIKLAIYCLKAGNDFYNEVCEECTEFSNCDHFKMDVLMDKVIKALETMKPKKNETDAKYARINSMLFNYYENKREKSLRDAIRSIDCDPYMDIIVFYYRDRMTIEQIAESYKVDTSTIVRNKRRLCLAIYDSLYAE